MIGTFAGVVFEVSDSKKYTIKDVSRSAESRWSSHDVIGSKPKSSFDGPGLDTIDFTIELDMLSGVDVKSELDKWLNFVRTGIVDTLIIGVPLGVYKWKVVSVEQGLDIINNNGKILKGTLNVSMEEYV